jgi:hypothetical protein
MHQVCISKNYISSVMPKKLEIRKIVKTVKEPEKPKQTDIELSQIRRRI